MAENKFQRNDARCVPMSRMQAALGGKWKILILWYVACCGVQRFGELSRRDLEADGFLRRTVYPQVPPRVEYSLTAQGESFVPILEQMLRWSEANLCPPEDEGR